MTKWGAGQPKFVVQMVTMATLGIQGLYSKERFTTPGKNDSRRARRFSLNLCKAGDNVGRLARWRFTQKQDILRLAKNFPADHANLRGICRFQ